MFYGWNVRERKSISIQSEFEVGLRAHQLDSGFFLHRHKLGAADIREGHNSEIQSRNAANLVNRTDNPTEGNHMAIYHMISCYHLHSNSTLILLRVNVVV